MYKHSLASASTCVVAMLNDTVALKTWPTRQCYNGNIVQHKHSMQSITKLVLKNHNILEFLECLWNGFCLYLENRINPDGILQRLSDRRPPPPCCKPSPTRQYSTYCLEYSMLKLICMQIIQKTRVSARNKAEVSRTSAGWSIQSERVVMR